MLYKGKTLYVSEPENGIAKLCFDREDAPVNKFDEPTLGELAEAIGAIEKTEGIKGLLVASAKAAFIVGADIVSFNRWFAEGIDALRGRLAGVNETFNRLEDLPFPTVAAINGHALGGGFEICMACDYRVASGDSQIGFPETQLGILPGWGGTVRFPRVTGVDVAAEWIASGKQKRAEEALKVHAVDSVVDPEALEASALHVLRQAIDGKIDHRARWAAKVSPLPLNEIEAGLAFGAAKGFVAAASGPNYPAPLAALTAMEKSWDKGREAALANETAAFLSVASTETASSLIGIFLNDQYIAKKAKDWEKKAEGKVERAAVLGAGIMGGGIAYQSSLKGIPIKMKDIVQAGLDLGLSEANNLLGKLVEKGRMKPRKMGEILNRIEPTLSYEGFDRVDIVVEAVVENPKVKHAVLTELEGKVAEDTIIASNTSTISIDLLAAPLKRPENFCGMHFFNPVHKMPLVEVIRGSKTSDAAVAKTVAYANAMGKKAIVVNDCPGFLVNRVLFPYLEGFSLLLRDGADFQTVDKAMEKWGWPMGPAYLCDVVGIDTGAHCLNVMAEGFPARMAKRENNALDLLYRAGRYGQKNAKGFYDYQPDKRGRLKKTPTEISYALLADHVAPRREFGAEEIVSRTMIPMALEIARCLEEGIVASPAEADLALVYGLGFPPFRGGLFKWIDTIGTREFCEMAQKYAALSPLYEAPEGLREMAAHSKRYYGG